MGGVRSPVFLKPSKLALDNIVPARGALASENIIPPSEFHVKTWRRGAYFKNILPSAELHVKTWRHGACLLEQHSIVRTFRQSLS